MAQLRMTWKGTSTVHRPMILFSRQFLFLILLLQFLISTVVALDVANQRTTPPYRRLQIDLNDQLQAFSYLNVSGPPELLGRLAFAPSPSYGQMFTVSAERAAAGDFLVRLPIIIPNSKDDVYACNPLKYNVSDEGIPYAGALLLIERLGCPFAQKAQMVGAAGAAGIINHGCPITPPYNCLPRLSSTLGARSIPVPSIYIGTADGYLIRGYLNRRRAWFNANRTLPSNSTDMTDYSIAPMAELTGTGPLDPAELAAFRTAAASITQSVTQARATSSLALWSNFNDPTFDPCINRLIGLWCERGHATIFQSGEPMGLSGTLSPAWGSFPLLRHLDINTGGITGAVPDEICKLSQLMILITDGQQLNKIPDCFGPAPLQHFSVSNMRLSSLPANLAQSTLLAYFAANRNSITSVPIGVSQLSNLWRFDLSYNPTLTGPVPNFSGTVWLYEIRCSNTAFTVVPAPGTFAGCSQLNVIDFSFSALSGQLNSTVFNGLSNLGRIDLSSNPNLGGTVPEFAGCTLLSSITLTTCQFTGGIPNSFKALTSLSSLKLGFNRLTGPFSALSFCFSCSEIELHNNLISTVGNSANGDPGEVLNTVIPSSLTRLTMDHNHLSGKWNIGWMSPRLLLQSVSISNNQLTNLPADLFTLNPISWDFSYNNLTGAWPTAFPSTKFVSLDLRNNPQLSLWPLPTWLSIGTDDATAIPGALYTCKQLVASTNKLFIPKADPSFVLYNGCSCARGTFGFPPLCQPVPEAAIVSPYDVFRSDEVGSDFGKMLMNNVTVGDPTIAALNALINPQSINANSTNSTSSTTAPPPTSLSYGMTDDMYGNNRLTLGVNTQWEIDLSDVLQEVATGKERLWAHNLDAKSRPGAYFPSGFSMVTNTALTSPTTVLPLPTHQPFLNIPVDGEVVPSTAAFQPVRIIYVRLHVSTVEFDKSSDKLEVYEGGADLKGTRLVTILGTDQLSPLTLTNYASTPEYQARYATQLARLQNATLLEYMVTTNVATIHFQSRDVAGQHFFATYSYAFACPQGYFLEMKNTSTRADKQQQYRCRLNLEEYNVSVTVRVGTFLIAAVAVIWVVLQFACVLKYWESPIYRASSRGFLLLMFLLLVMMGFGAMLYAAVPDPSDSNKAHATCIGRAWLTGIPLSGVLAVLFAKTNRLNTIFGSLDFAKSREGISDMDLARTVIFVVLLECALCFAYSFVPLSRPLHDRGVGSLTDVLVMSCSTESGFMVWLAVQVAYFAALLVISGYLAFKTRGLPSAFNESVHIAICIVLLIFFMVIIVPLTLYVSDVPEATVALQGVGQALLTVLLTSVLFAPKMYAVLTQTPDQLRAMMQTNASSPPQSALTGMNKSRVSAASTTAKPNASLAAAAAASRGESMSNVHNHSNSGKSGSAPPPLLRSASLAPVQRALPVTRVPVPLPRASLPSGRLSAGTSTEGGATFPSTSNGKLRNGTLPSPSKTPDIPACVTEEPSGTDVPVSPAKPINDEGVHLHLLPVGEEDSNEPVSIGVKTLNNMDAVASSPKSCANNNSTSTELSSSKVAEEVVPPIVAPYDLKPPASPARAGTEIGPAAPISPSLSSRTVSAADFVAATVAAARATISKGDASSPRAYRTRISALPSSGESAPISPREVPASASIASALNDSASSASRRNSADEAPPIAAYPFSVNQGGSVH